MSNVGLANLKRRNGIDKKALGRGIGSGCGKTSSYGHKGGKARSGRGKTSWFEGGQMPLYRRLPKRGFISMRDSSSIASINLMMLQKWCDNNIISADQEINIGTLKSANIIAEKFHTMRLFGTCELKTALKVAVKHVSAGAERAIKAAGGKVTIV